MSIIIEKCRQPVAVREDISPEWRDALYTSDGLHFAVAIRLPKRDILGGLSGREILGQVNIKEIITGIENSENPNEGIEDRIKTTRHPILLIPIMTTINKEEVSSILGNLSGRQTIETILKALSPEIPMSMSMTLLMALANEIPCHDVNTIGIWLGGIRCLVTRINTSKNTINKQSSTTRADTVEVTYGFRKEPHTPQEFADFMKQFEVDIVPLSQEVLATKIQEFIS